MRVRAGGALAAAALLAGCGGEPGPASPPETLLLVTLEDVVPADLVDARVMPALHALRATSAVYEDLLDEGLGATASLATVVTGLTAAGHLVGDRPGRHRLRPGLRTLAEALAADGWRTFGFAARARFDERLSGFEQGFEVWATPRFDRDAAPWTGSEVVDRVLDAAGPALDGAERVFLWVHLADTRGEPPEPGPDDVPFFERRLQPFRAEPEVAAALARLAEDPAGAVEEVADALARWRGRPEKRALDDARRDVALRRLDGALERLLVELAARGRPPTAYVVQTIPVGGAGPVAAPALVGPRSGPHRVSSTLGTRHVPVLLIDRDVNGPKAVPQSSSAAVAVRAAGPGEVRVRVVLAREADVRADGGEPEPRDEVARFGPDAVALALELDDPRPAFRVQVHGAPAPAVLALPGAARALPRLPASPLAEWSRDEPPALEVERGVGRRLRFTVAGSGPAELILCTWPPVDDLDVAGDAEIERLPGSDALVRARGPAPLAVEVERPASAELAVCASRGGEPVPASAVRWLGRAFEGDARVAVVVPAWLPPAMRGTGAPPAGAVTVTVRDPDVPDDAWSVVTPAVRRFLERRP